MNKTKRKIFETSMKLFAEKGYDATSVEEITATVGVAKGTLYYHFSSKEEIYNFLLEEGTKLLINNIDVKVSKIDNSIDKLRSIALLQLRVITKYQNLITIYLSQVWGSDERNQKCQKYINDYIGKIEEVVKEGIEKGEIKEGNSGIIASEIFAFTCAGFMFKIKSGLPLDIKEMCIEFDKMIYGLKREK
ncbi:MAG: TetR/AcrR family transcriptional regulator [Clostridia bacterium]|jgi:AcrR family transcriptional regulator|nr:TetR/AcrR family transcriptional regulator [Clostridia bacterium]